MRESGEKRHEVQALGPAATGWTPARTATQAVLDAEISARPARSPEIFSPRDPAAARVRGSTNTFRAINYVTAKKGPLAAATQTRLTMQVPVFRLPARKVLG